jgi:hypothetical protein
VVAFRIGLACLRILRGARWIWQHWRDWRRVVSGRRILGDSACLWPSNLRYSRGKGPDRRWSGVR